jgi:hypothetical protein
MSNCRSHRLKAPAKLATDCIQDRQTPATRCRDAKEGVGSTSRKRRRRSRVLSLRNLLVAFALFSCFGTLLFLYTRLMPKLP